MSNVTHIPALLVDTGLRVLIEVTEEETTYRDAAGRKSTAKVATRLSCCDQDVTWHMAEGCFQIYPKGRDTPVQAIPEAACDAVERMLS